MSYYGTTSNYFAQQAGYGTSRGWLFYIIVSLAVLIFGGVIVWFAFYRESGVTIIDFYMNIFTGIINILLWPIRFLLELLGFWTVEAAAPPPPPVTLPTLPTPPPPQVQTTVVKHELSECPPCTNENNCPECKDCDQVVGPLETEIKYLKEMLKFVGAIARRENAQVAQYKQLYPGFNVHSPHVRKLSHEYNFIKNEIRKDKDMWQYFKNYFTSLTNIPSNSTAYTKEILI